VAGEIVAINPAMDLEPEVINMDPYGEGWLADIRPENGQADQVSLLDPPTYFNLMKGQADEEAENL
jgi:glycine cleavage system H protein